MVLPVVFLLIMNCAAQESKKEFDMIQYKAQTRGSSLSVKIINNEIFYVSNGNEGSSKLSEENTRKLSKLIKEVRLEEMKTLKAPTDKRITDGALHAEFTVKVADKEYKSITFDAGNAPKELKELEDLLYELSKLKQ